MSRWRDWRALHLFLGADGDMDRLLTESMGPAVRAAGLRLGQWFFIRYWELGLHVRIRARTRDERQFERLRARLSSELPAFLGAPGEAKADRGEPEGRPPSTGRILPGQAIEFTYEPEFTRYGGPLALAVSERLFGISSKLALDTMKQCANDLEARARSAIDFVLAVIVLLPNDRDRTAFLGEYAAGWRKFFAASQSPVINAGPPLRLPAALIRARLEVFEKSLSSGRTATAAPLIWAQNLHHAGAKFRRLSRRRALISQDTGVATDGGAARETVIREILKSQMHMMANRLGFFPASELRWTEALKRCFQATDCDGINTGP